MADTCTIETEPAAGELNPADAGRMPPQEYLPPYTPQQLLQIAERITARYDPADQEDAAQEFVMGALLAAKRSKPGMLTRSYQWACGMGRVKHFLTAKTRRRAKVCVCLDAPADDGSSGLTKGDLVPDPKAVDPQASSDASDLHRELDALIDALPDEQMRYIIRQRFWSGRGMEAIGAELGITGERARQLLSEGFAGIRMMIVAAEAV